MPISDTYREGAAGTMEVTEKFVIRVIPAESPALCLSKKSMGFLKG
jgi:hypothetical protein